ncbi:MAG TPA: phosphate ABC transporter permease PstA [Thermoplasmata archaeon]|nr:phosphate ABC transporter permease PstA [Thermoplasmata archaeon]
MSGAFPRTGRARPARLFTTRDGRRRLFSYLMAALCCLCVVLALIPLGSIIYTATVRGLPAFSGSFLTANPPAPCNPLLCQQGGIWAALQGSLVMVGLASLFSIPLGVLAGIFLSEWGHLRVVRGMRFFIEVMTGIPSIVVGVFAYALYLYAADAGVIPISFVLSALSGASALSVIMVPIVARTTDGALQLVPVTIREAALALGLPRWRVTLRVVLSTGRAAVVTGALLGFARAMGETAPLIMTASFSFFPITQLNERTASIPLLIFLDGRSSYGNQVAIAWGAALFIILMVLAVSITARLLAGSAMVRGVAGGT